MTTRNGYIFEDKILTFGNSPGYRDCSLGVQINDGTAGKQTVELRLSKADAESLLVDLLQVFQLAWRERPIDAEAHETKPAFLNYVLPALSGIDWRLR